MELVSLTFKCNNELHPTLWGERKHYNRNNMVVRIAKKRNEEITKLGAVPVMAAVGDVTAWLA